jgi:hypothetical protein
MSDAPEEQAMTGATDGWRLAALALNDAMARAMTKQVNVYLLLPIEYARSAAGQN